MRYSIYTINMHRSLLICALVSLVINVAAEGMQMITVEDKVQDVSMDHHMCFIYIQVIHPNGALALEEEVGV